MSAGLQGQASRRTLYREVQRAGYKFLPVARKGLLSAEDRKTRLKFCKAMASKPDSFWSKSLCFYLDCVSFTHRYNPFSSAGAPRGKLWRKPNERLVLTGKGHHEGTEGRVMKFVVAISHGKGVVIFKELHRMTGAWFAKFVKEVFPQAFLLSNKGRLFLQDNCPCQNSRVAKKAVKRLSAAQFYIPPRSPDLNPIENIFHIVKQRLSDDAYNRRIYYETPAQFKRRIRETLDAVVRQHGDKTIESMPRRFKEVAFCPFLVPPTFFPSILLVNIHPSLPGHRRSWCTLPLLTRTSNGCDHLTSGLYIPPGGRESQLQPWRMGAENPLVGAPVLAKKKFFPGSSSLHTFCTYRDTTSDKTLCTLEFSIIFCCFGLGTGSTG